jgi:hypothetical protein
MIDSDRIVRYGIAPETAREVLYELAELRLRMDWEEEDGEEEDSDFELVEEPCARTFDWSSPRPSETLAKKCEMSGDANEK